ncbi:hypothetical protein, partial [Escherichia coli]|uniref:hypothetical protein n=1 Tax=Escherichia coli TaxID=562 RepID=UPI003CE484C7
APLARDRFPSTTNKTDDNYITFDWETDYTTQEALWGNALAKLTIYSEPQLTYEVDGYFDTNVGDTVSIQDEDCNPMLILEARVTKQTE